MRYNRKSNWKNNKQNKYISKFRKGILYIIFLFLVLFSGYKLIINGNNEKFTKTCILNAKTIESNSCDDVIGIRNSDYCNFFKRDCYKIEDISTKYVCNRLRSRGHMSSFINKPIELCTQDLPNIAECSNDDKNDKYKCLINLAIQKFSLDESASEKVCSKIRNSNLRGECKFYLIINYIPKLILYPEKYYNSINDFCSEIVNPSWKSECFYLMADELTLNSIGNESFDLIINACIQSDDSFQYACFNHNAQLMKDRGKDFCNSVPEDKKDYCFSGYGFYQGDKLLNESLMKLIELCKDTKYVKSCMTGVISSISLIPSINRTTFFLNTCIKMPKEFKESCFFGFGKLLTILQIEENISINQTQHCNLVPNEYKGICHQGFVDRSDRLPNTNLNKALELCEDSSLEFRSYCYQGILDQFEKYVNKGNIEKKELCNLFPIEYLESCKNNLNDY